MQYFEDVEVGVVQRFGRYEVTREEVTAFAAKYDPQPFHLSDEAAAATHFGRLSASGWHTCAMTMAMIVANLKEHRQAGLGSPGVDELRWLRPVYPGDTLRCESELIEKRASRSRPEMGITNGRLTVFNQDDVAVLTMISNGLIATRPSAQPPRPGRGDGRAPPLKERCGPRLPGPMSRRFWRLSWLRSCR